MKHTQGAMPEPDISQLSPQELIEAYLPVVKTIASHVICKCPANVELDDLINVGVVGLMDAAERFNHAFGKPFRFYAELRIRGEMLDELRSQDWMPRSTRKQLTLIERKRIQLEREQGPDVSDATVAEALGFNLQEFQEVCGKALVGSTISLEDLGVQQDEQKDLLQVIEGGNVDPDAMFRVREMEAVIAEAIHNLPHREKVMISLYYYQDLSLREIGCVLGVSESRVCQMHTKALSRLRKAILWARLEQS